LYRISQALIPHPFLSRVSAKAPARSGDQERYSTDSVFVKDIVYFSDSRQQSRPIHFDQPRSDWAGSTPAARTYQWAKPAFRDVASRAFQCSLLGKQS
jgi:hypothetical protein